jgi:hypothetical protein
MQVDLGIELLSFSLKFDDSDIDDNFKIFFSTDLKKVLLQKELENSKILTFD